MDTKKFAKQSQVDAFRDSMDDKDRLIHGLAITMLKTRYSVERSNGFRAFAAKMAKVSK
jgi:hypothetical protein